MKSFEHFGIQCRQNIQAGITASVFTILFTLFTVSDAQAHRINLFCRFEGSTLHGEAYFSGGNPVKNSMVSIYALDTGKKLASGVTSGEGTFTIPLEKKVPVKTVLDAGQGHQASWTWNQTSERTGPEEIFQTDRQNPFTAIAAGLAAIAVIFGIIYLRKRSNAA